MITDEKRPVNGDDRPFEAQDEFSGLDLEPFKQVFAEFERFYAKNGSINLYIDGSTRSGRTTLAAVLQKKYGGNVFHLDDYFVPLFRMKAEGLARYDYMSQSPHYYKLLNLPGQIAFRLVNYDYDRFDREVGRALKYGLEPKVRRLNLLTQRLSRPQKVPVSKINIVEGDYAFCATKFVGYGLSVFIKPSAELEKIRLKDAAEDPVLRRFPEKLLKRNNKYFTLCELEQRADVVAYPDVVSYESEAKQDKLPPV